MRSRSRSSSRRGSIAPASTSRCSRRSPAAADPTTPSSSRSPRERRRTTFADRSSRLEGFELNLLVERFGKLGPEPPGLAIWTLPDYGALATIARDLDGADGPVELVTAALYHELGREIL
jgi:hypothetical protein